jgi:hypothetical protein
MLHSFPSPLFDWAAKAIKLIDGRPENTNHRSIKSAALHQIDSYHPPLPLSYFIFYIIDAAHSSNTKAEARVVSRSLR